MPTSAFSNNRPTYRPPVIRPISQAAFQIVGNRAFERAVQEVVQWMKGRNQEIPDQAFEAAPFRVGAGAIYPAEAVLIDADGPRLWAATLEDNREQRDYGRTWVTEVTIGEYDGKAAFGARLSLVMRGEPAAFQPSRPGCIHKVLSNLTASSDGRRLLENPAEVNTGEDILGLVELLENKQRKLPVVVISTDDRGIFGVDPLRMAQRVSGLAHIVTITDRASWELTHVLGKANSTFRGATRLYRPKFDSAEGNPFDHPLWFNKDNSALARAARLDLVVNQVTNASLSAFTGDDSLPRYEDVRRAAAETVIQAKQIERADGELISLYEAEIDRLKESIAAQKSEHDEAMQLASDELAQAESARGEALSERVNLLMRVASLEAALRDRGQPVLSEPLLAYEDIEDWAKKNLTGSIWLSRKAIRETEKNRQFEDVNFFGRTLLMLRDAFVPMKRFPGEESHSNYQRVLQDMNLTDELCFSP